MFRRSCREEIEEEIKQYQESIEKDGKKRYLLNYLEALEDELNLFDRKEKTDIRELMISIMRIEYKKETYRYDFAHYGDPANEVLDYAEGLGDSELFEFYTIFTIRRFTQR